MAAAAAGGGSGVIPATVHVQVRRLQPVLPGARGRAAGRARHHRVLPGGVEVQVRQPPLHAMTTMAAVQAARKEAADESAGRGAAAGPTYYAALLHRAGRVALACAARARCRGPRRARAWAGSALCSARGGRGDLPH